MHFHVLWSHASGHVHGLRRGWKWSCILLGSEKHRFRETLSWFVLEGALSDLGLRQSCQGEGHDELYDRRQDCMKACVMSQKKCRPEAE